jgi:hypothetical protein
MKSFARFIKEAVETLASTEAKNRGLKGDGHGDWYDNQGNLIAKTVGGKLKYFGQGGSGAQQQQGAKKQAGAQQQQAPTQQAAQQQQQAEPEQVNGVAIVIGRFNPPSKNHGALLKAGYSQATRIGFEFRVYPSRIEDGATNPLNPGLKIDYMQSMFPEYAEYIVDSDNAKTIFDVLGSVYDDGYTDVVIITGQDRLGEFQSLVHKGDGQQYQFNNIEVVPSGVKDPDSDVESPGSSAMMRTAAATGNYERFATGLPANMDTTEKQEMFNTVSRSMKVSEDTEIWKIAPEMDYEGMRWNYKKNGLFDVGALVENLNSGLVGRILRRGANHLICVTNEGVMFKSWLKDVREVYEVGTCDYRAYTQKMTPGQPIVSYTDVEVKKTMPNKKINTNRKKLSAKK